MEQIIQEIKEIHQQADQAYHQNDFEKMRQLIETLFLEEYTDSLIYYAEKLIEVKKLIEDENITKTETVDKISKIVNS